MSKRYTESDSDDNGSDEDDGNFKRKRRHYSSDDSKEDFVQKTLKSFVTPEPKNQRNFVDSREQQIIIKKQKLREEKQSKLPKYDDLFDSTVEECLQTTSATGKTVSSSDKTPVDLKIVTNVEVSTDEVDFLAGDDSGDAFKTIDPRLRRLNKFKIPEPVVTRIEGPALVRKVNELLNNRKPYEAYIQLKAEVTQLELHKYIDLLMVMSKDWFPSQIDTAIDPRNVFIESTNLNSFSNLLKDVFSTKIKSKEFWESVILSIEKFIEESKIKELPQFITKLRWILVRDIREYLINEEVKIPLKVGQIILKHKVKLDNNRENHRRQFELNYTAKLMPTPTPSSAPEVPKVPIIVSSRPVVTQPKPQKIDPFEDLEIETMAMPSHSNAVQMPDFGSNPNQNERRTITQILECLANDQYFKLIQMMDRHTRNQTYNFIDNFGHALRLFIEKIPKFSVFTIYQKLHDTLFLNANNFKSYRPNNDNRLEVIFTKLLKEFHQTVIFNVKEWLLIRDHTRTEQFHFSVTSNPFNQPFAPILHNIVINCGYISNRLVLNYNALEQEIPLMSLANVIMKDPRIEFCSEDYVKSQEVVDLDESVVGVFSPIRSESSQSPEYNTSDDNNSDSISEANSEEMVNLASPEHPISTIESEPQVNGQTSTQKTENANPVKKVLTSKSKVMKTVSKKLLPLKNKTNSNKTLRKRHKVINKTVNKVNKSHKTVPKTQTNNKVKEKVVTNNEIIGKSVINVKTMSAVKPQESSATEPICPTNDNISPIVSINVNKPVVNVTVVPQKRIIKLSNGSNNRFNESELRKIRRRVSISSDESSNED